MSESPGDEEVAPVDAGEFDQLAESVRIPASTEDSGSEDALTVLVP
jgi:hypothetical protein